MIVASDAVADINRDAHDAELKTLARVFAELRTVDEVVTALIGTEQRQFEALRT